LNINGRRARLWDRLELGPVWVRRDETGGRGAAAGPDAPPRAPAPAGDAAAGMDWDELERAVAACTACGLCKTRSRTVFGVGQRDAQWMVIGEAPGAEEDLRGEPFVGQAGKLLDAILSAAGLGRAASGRAGVYIANVVKCRPPGNRNPEPEEAARCEPYLRRQIELLRPRVILLLGRVAAQAVLGTDASIAALRGHAHHTDLAGGKVPIVVTYHPAYLLRNLADKAKVWADLCLARDIFEQTPERR
jgi:uracil-DNA glycosylase family 4